MTHNENQGGGDMDAGDFILVITAAGKGTRTIKQFTGLNDWKVDKQISYNEGPGGRVYGFNHQRHSNKVSFSFSVRETSEDISWLQDLIDSEDEVHIEARVHQDSLQYYTDEQEVLLGGSACIIMGGSRGKGNDQAEDVSFDVTGRDPLRKTKKQLVAG